MNQVSSTQSTRKLPKESLYIDSSDFWLGVREGRLMLQFCTESGRYQHFPRPISLYTGKRTLEWREASGAGTIYAVTTLRTKGLGADDRLPCVLALVELDEGVRILANLIGVAPGDAVIGDRVHLCWDQMSDGQYPAFSKQQAQ